MNQEESDREAERRKKLWNGATEEEMSKLNGALLIALDTSNTYMSGGYLRGVYLRGAYMKGRGTTGYSEWLVCCGSLKAQIDERIARQILYHVLSAVSHSKNCSEEFKAALLTETNVTVANGFHRVEECGYLKVYHGEEEIGS